MERAARNIRSVVSVGQMPGLMTSAYTIHRRGRYWAVLDSGGVLVCMTVYKCGAEEVIRRLVGKLRS